MRYRGGSRKKSSNKKIVSDSVYVLLQPWLVYFAFGSGRGRIPPQARFVLMALVGLMMIVNLYFCEEDCFRKMQENAWALTFALLVQSVVLVVPAMVRVSAGI